VAVIRRDKGHTIVDIKHVSQFPGRILAYNLSLFHAFDRWRFVMQA